MLHSAPTVISGRTLIHQTVWLPFRCRVPWTKFLSHGFKPLTAFCINIWKHFKTYNYAGYSSLVQPMSGFHRYLRHNLCFCEQQTHATLWGCRGDRIKLSIWVFIDKQPMKAGQGLKWTLATLKLTQKKENDTHTHKQISTNRKRVKRWGHIKKVYLWTKTDTSV